MSSCNNPNNNQSGQGSNNQDNPLPRIDIPLPPSLLRDLSRYDNLNAMQRIELALNIVHDDYDVLLDGANARRPLEQSQ